jgi:hypothetical protein
MPGTFLEPTFGAIIKQCTALQKKTWKNTVNTAKIDSETQLVLLHSAVPGNCHHFSCCIFIGDFDFQVQKMSLYQTERELP